MTSVRDQHIQLGRAHAVRSFSQAALPLPPGESNKTLCDILSGLTAAPVRTSCLGDRARIQQFAFVFQGKIEILSCPQVFSDTTVAGDPVIKLVGSLSDSMDLIVPVSINFTKAMSFASALVPQALVAKYNLPTLEMLVDDIAGGGPDAVAPSMNRLAFGQTDDQATHPKLAALPVLYPVPKGALVEAHLALDADVPVPTDVFGEAFHMWRHAAVYAFQHNGGQSKHLHGTLFAKDGFTGDVMTPFVGLAFDDWNLLPTPLMPGSTAFTVVVNAVMAYRDSIWEYLGGQSATGIPAAAPVVGPAGGTRGPVVPAVDTTLESLTDALKNIAQPKSQKETERMQLADEVVLSYRLLFAALTPSADGGPVEVVPATLQTAFVSLLQKQGNAGAQADLKKMFRSAISTAGHSDNRLDAAVEFDANVATQAFATCIRLFDFNLEPININHVQAKTKITVYNFCPPCTASAAFQDLAEENDLIKKDMLVMGKREVSALGTTALYLGGRIQRVGDVVTTLCNIRLVGSQFTEHFDGCQLWALLRPIEKLLSSKEGKVWAQAMQDYPAVPVNVLNHIQLAVSQLVCHAQDATNIQAVRDLEPVHKSMFREATSIMTVLERDLRLAMTMHQPGPFSKRPVGIFQLLGIGQTGPAPTAGTVTPSSSFEDHKAKKPRVSEKRNDDVPALSKKLANMKLGILEYYGPQTTKPPLLDVFHSDPRKNDGKSERLCGHFMIRGFACTQAGCARHHVTNVGTLPPDVRAKLEKAVGQSTVLKFVPGKGPAGN